MGSIISFLEGIANFFVSICDFVIGFFGDIVFIIQITGELLQYLPSYFSWLPGSLLRMLLITYSIVIIYKITGREG